jgi:hypothetical protein
MLSEIFVAWTVEITFAEWYMIYVVFGNVIVVDGFEVEVCKNDERQEWCEV